MHLKLGDRLSVQHPTPYAESVHASLCGPGSSGEEKWSLHAGATTTRFLESLPFTPKAIEVVAPGMNTTVQVPSLAPLHSPSAQPSLLLLQMQNKPGKCTIVHATPYPLIHISTQGSNN